MGILGVLFGKKNRKSDPIKRLERIEEGQRKYGNYLDVPAKVKKLKAKGNNKKAISLLLTAVELVEAESEYIGGDWGVAPWYYEQLAIIYRKEKNYSAEVNILERYAKQTKAVGKGPEKLADRLVKAKALRRKMHNKRLQLDKGLPSV